MNAIACFLLASTIAAVHGVSNKEFQTLRKEVQQNHENYRRLLQLLQKQPTGTSSVNLNLVLLQLLQVRKEVSLETNKVTSLDKKLTDHLCKNKNVNGAWSAWGSYGKCSKTCGGGVQRRSRSCNNPVPANGGSSCPGSNRETLRCNMNACPVNGAWSTWGSYGTCSKTCGGGVQTRSRSCNNPVPANGGSSCPGSNTETHRCNVKSCHAINNIIFKGRTYKSYYPEYKSKYVGIGYQGRAETSNSKRLNNMSFDQCSRFCIQKRKANSKWNAYLFCHPYEAGTYCQCNSRDRGHTPLSYCIHYRFV